MGGGGGVSSPTHFNFGVQGSTIRCILSFLFSQASVEDSSQ